MSNSFLRLKSVIRRRAWIALPAIASAAGASLLYLLITPPTYRTSAQLIVDNREVSISNLGQRLTDLGNTAPGQSDPIATQAELIRSQSVLKEALEKTKLTFPSVTDRFLDTNMLRSSISVEILPATNIIRLSVKARDPEITAELTNNIAEAALASNIETIRQEASTVREFLESKIPEQQFKLQQAELEETNYRRSSSIVDPQAQAQQLIGQISNLEIERDRVAAELQEADARSRQLQNVTGVSTSDAAYLSTRAGQDAVLTALQQEITALNVQMAEAGARLGEQHPDWLSMLDQSQQLQELYSAQLSRLLPASSNQVAGDELTQNLFTQFIQEQVGRQGLGSRLTTVENELSALQSRLSRFPEAQLPLANLVRRRQEAEASLQFLQSQLEEAQLAEAQLTGSVRIIGLAEVPSTPVAPSPIVVLLLGGLVGLALTAAMIALLEASDNTLRTAGETEDALRLPVLGVFPRLSQIDRINGASQLSYFLSNPELVEPYRLLLTVLSFQVKLSNQLKYPDGVNIANNSNNFSDGVRGQKAQTIVLTSPFSKEEKSVVALRMAAVSALLSQKTLLVDADFGADSQYEKFTTSQLSSLKKENFGFEISSDMIRSTEIENLHILTTGKNPGQSSAMIEGKAIQRLLERAKLEYDFIVIDTAPAGICADAATLSQYADGLMLVISSGISQRDAADHVATELKRSGVSILGVALNNVTAVEDTLRSGFDSERPISSEYKHNKPLTQKTGTNSLKS